MRRRSTGTAMPAWVSVRMSSPRRTLPLSGARSPEMMLTRVVLPLPERPKRAMTPGVGAAKSASRANPDRRMLTATCSTATPTYSPAQSPAHPAHQQLGGEQPRQAKAEGQQREAQRQRVAAGSLHGGVERQRQRARDAGNVGGEGDDGAELSESGGEGGHRARMYVRQHQRQGDR